LFSGLLLALYRVRSPLLRGAIRGLARRLEGGDLHSVTLRRIFARHHGIEVGFYSGGGAFIPGNFATQTKVGRFCSIAYNARSFNANHPMNLKSSSALFYNPAVGYTETDLLTRASLTIGHDVWIGHNAVILPSVSSIGDGAVIGAGAVVHQDAPPYGIVVGHPARVVRYRFSEEVIQQLQAERWWERPLEELLPEIEEFQRPLEGTEIR
jgi:acetyltransferase-like isoleucine patch superfamily enzyme